MNSTAEKNLQEEILLLLETDPQKAMSLAVEGYTGLLWHVAEQYLKNPEDIKECVNDTFMEFYTGRDCFDSSKGSLASFLAAITRNLAVSRYRKENVRRTLELDEEIPGDTGQMEQVDRKLDLEKAMAVLKPEDMDIIRMKYYGGMTIQEIADSLGLPYETVKKRHQRGLGRMRLAMIAALVILLAMLLAACAYIVIRYFGIVPGFGLVSEPDLPIYILEESITIENEIGTYVLENAFVVNGEFLASGSVHFNSEDRETWRPGEQTEVAVLQDGDKMYICLTGYYVELPQDIEFESQTESMEMPPEGQAVWEMTWDWAGVQFPLRLKLSGAEEFRRYDYRMGKKGGVLAIPRVKKGNLLVDLYPLFTEEASQTEGNPGAESESFAGGWNPEGPYDIQFKDIIAVAPDGEEIQGSVEPHPRQYFTIYNFGEAQAGEYTIRIPSVQLIYPYNGSMTIPINLETCEWEDVEYDIPGGRVSVESCERVYGEECEVITLPDDFQEVSFNYWKIVLRYTMEEETEDESLSVPEPTLFSPNCPVLDYEKKFYIACRPIGDRIEEGYEEYFVGLVDGTFDLSRFEMVPNCSVEVSWKCDLNIPITVEIPE